MVDSTGLEPVTPCTSSIMGLPPQSIDISRVSAIHKPCRCHAGATHKPNKAMGRSKRLQEDNIFSATFLCLSNSFTFSF